MQYKTYASAENFLDRALKYLEKDEAENNLIIGISNKIKNSGSLYKQKPFFATLADGDKIILAAVMTPPRQIILYGKDYSSDALKLFCHNLIKENISIPGANGESALVKNFAGIWSALKNCTYKPGMHTRAYSLEKVKYRGTANGRLSLPDKDDAELIACWIQKFCDDAHIGRMSWEDALETAEFQIKKKLIYLWEDGEKVSMAAVIRETRHGSVVALVYTPQEYRNKGYGTSCVAALSQRILDSGKKFSALFTDLSNPTSNSIYMKIGYEPLRDFDEYSFDYKDE